jgi:porphobilinogen deaminase
VSDAPKRRGRIENLKPWKKGQSGNPGGYSRGRRMQARLNEILDRISGQATIEEAVNERLVVEALNGNIAAYIAIRDTVDGRPRQAVELSGPDGGPIHNLNDIDARILELLERGADRASAARRESGAGATARAQESADAADPTA